MTKGRPVVAVVDDDPRLLESLEDLLESAGYAARSFSSAGSLLASGLSGVDLLITDIGMPGMDGFELRDLVKKARPDLPVFLITGRHEIADQEPGAGHQRFLPQALRCPGPAFRRRRSLAQPRKGRVNMNVDQKFPQNSRHRQHRQDEAKRNSRSSSLSTTTPLFGRRCPS